MPPRSIDTTGLKARAAELSHKYGDLDSLQIALRLLLLEYAEPGRRTPTPLPGESVGTTYGVPLPVLRAVVNSLRKRALAAPLAALVLLDRLWQSGSLEERRIAAELLALVGPQAPAASMRLVDSWLAGLADSTSADVLASVGFAPLLRSAPGERLPEVARWLASDNEWTRRFGAMAVADLARDKTYHEPAALLEILRGSMADPSAEVRRGVVTALWGIAPKSPGDLARFLRRFDRAGDPAARWVIRQTLNGLPAHLQREVGGLMKEG